MLGLGRQWCSPTPSRRHCLGTAYATANQVPNIIYDIVLGGALTSVMVPVLAGSARRAGTGPGRRPAEVSQDLLGPADLDRGHPGPGERDPGRGRPARSTSLLNPANPAGQLRHASMISRDHAGMLVVFAPQILLYGLAVVLYGILQAHRRFTAPALAPVVSSLVVIAAYLLFVPLGRGTRGSGRPARCPPS